MQQISYKSFNNPYKYSQHNKILFINSLLTQPQINMIIFYINFILNTAEMRETFYQSVMIENAIQCDLASKWGYNTKPIDFKKQGIHTNRNKPKITTTFDPLKMKERTLPPNKQIEKLEREIQYMESLRKQNKSQQQKQILELLNQRIQQYNYLIDHKHLSNKKSNQTAKILKIQPKSESQLILDEINNKKHNLVSAENRDIGKQIKMNKAINGLYRNFVEKMFQNHSTSNNALNQTQNIFNNKQQSNQKKQRSNSITFNELGRSTPNPSHYRRNTKQKQMIRKNMLKSMLNPQIMNKNLEKVQKNLRNIYFKGDNYNNLQIFPQKINKSEFNKSIRISQHIRQQPTKKYNSVIEAKIRQPFVDPQFLEKGKKMDMKIRNSQEAIELWKMRVHEACEKQQELINKKMNINKKVDNLNSVQQTPQQKKYIENEEEQQQSIFEQSLLPFINEQNNKQQNTALANKRKSKRIEQEMLVSGYLQKKNTKFLKPWGTKILVKYNSKQQAKNMLQGRLRRQSLHASVEASSIISKSSQKKKQLDNSQQLQTSFDKNSDKQYYEIMCKNEKINLLLKRNRR